MLQTTEIAPIGCPHCGVVHEVASSMTTLNGPEPGDINICIKCGGISIYLDDLSVRTPTVEEITDLSRDPDVRRHIQIWDRLKLREAIDAGLGPV